MLLTTIFLRQESVGFSIAELKRLKIILVGRSTALPLNKKKLSEFANNLNILNYKYSNLQGIGEKKAG